MQNLSHFHHRDLKQFQFGESRMVNIVGASALKGVVEGAMGDAKGSFKEAKEGVGKFKGAIHWMTHADSTLGHLFKWPLELTRIGVEATIGGFKIVDGAAVAMGQKVGNAFVRPFKEGGEEVIKLGGEVAGETATLGSNLVLTPALEITKSNLVDFPKRAIVDQFRSGLKMAFGVPGAFIDHSIDAVKRTILSPITIAKACRDAAKRVFYKVPKNLIGLEFKEAAKNLIKAPYEVAKGVLDAPLAIAGIPYHTTMEAGLGTLEMTMNGTRAMVAPIEGLVNSYRSMAKSTSFIEFIKKKVGADHVKTYRQRFGDLFKFQSPMATVAT